MSTLRSVSGQISNPSATEPAAQATAQSTRETTTAVQGDRFDVTSTDDPRLDKLLGKFGLERQPQTLGARMTTTFAKSVTALRASLGIERGLGRRIGANLRSLAQGLRKREQKLVQQAVSVVRALGMTAVKASTRNDLVQAFDFSKGTIAAGSPLAVVSPVLDVVEFVVKYPEEARKILQFIDSANKNTWAQKSAWMKGVVSGPGLVADPLKHRQDRADVVVIGSGLAGSSTIRLFASEFAKDRSKALDVIVIERDSKRSREHAASLRNAGIVCTVIDYLFGIDEAVGEKPIARIQEALSIPREEAEQAYESLMHVLRESTVRIREFLRDRSTDVEFATRGSIDVATSADDLEAFRAAAEQAQKLGMDWRAIDASYMKEHFGISGDHIHGGILFNDAGQLHPGKLVKALFEHAQKQSDRIDVQWDTELLSAKPDADGQGWELRTSQGTIRAKHVVDAREAFAPFSWSEPRYSQIHLLDTPGKEGPMALGDTSLCHGFSYMRKVADGQFIVGSGDFPLHHGAQPPAPLASIALYAAANFKKVYPDTPFDIEGVWGGVFGLAKDGLPVVGELAHGWHVIGGAGGTGLSYTPAMAEQTVQDVLGTGEASPFAPTESFSPRRFFLLELRHDLARLLSRDVTNVRVEVEEKKRSGIRTPPRKEGDRLVFSVDEKTLDGMNRDVAALFGEQGEQELKTRERAKAQWVAQQADLVNAGLVDDSPRKPAGPTSGAWPRAERAAS